jgi:hypothetical protein
MSRMLDLPPDDIPGRSCPLHYRYSPEVFSGEPPAALAGLEVLYVVSGLYGNELALERVRELFDRERGRRRTGCPTGLLFGDRPRHTCPSCDSTGEPMQSVKLDPSKLFGFKILQQPSAPAPGAKVGSKIGEKAGVKVGAKVGSKVGVKVGSPA